MKKLYYFLFMLLFLIPAMSTTAKAASTIQEGEEYFLYNLYYNRALGQKADGTPGLSVLGTNTIESSYIFVAENSGTEGFFLLRQKSTGRYLTASTSNTWSVVYESDRGTSNRYLWALTDGVNGYITSRQSPSKFLGCDTGKENDTYVSVFYDKDLTELSRWQILNAKEGFDQARKELYLNILLSSIESAIRISEQTMFEEALRLIVKDVADQAQLIVNSAAEKSVAEIIEITEALQTALTECLASDLYTLLAGNEFDVDQSFTVALNAVEFAGADGITMIVRNASGWGALIDLSASGISVDHKVVADGLSPETTALDYQFAFHGSTVDIYRNGTLLGTASMHSVPAYTSAGTGAEWSLLGGSALQSYIPEVVSASEAVVQGEDVVDVYGNKVRYSVFMNNVAYTLSEAMDFHIMDEEGPLRNSTLNLSHENAWVIFDNTLPSEVISKFLSSISVNGEKAVLDKNVRVGIYLNGAVVIPQGGEGAPFTGYSGEIYSGHATDVQLGANELGKSSNAFQSFILKRGYMATLASGSNGSGYSRVYVADHQDIMVPVLPQALNRRVSSVHVKKWNYVSKKGWCSTTSNSAIATECKKTRSTWFYTWSADRSSTYDTEYIPIWQHLYWPSISQINSHTNSTHVLGFNEPEHAEQHTSDKCSCGGVISPWTSCTKTPDLLASGMRIGSPSPTDASWLAEYIGHVDDMAYRCDFVAFHCYWGTNEAPNATSWYNQLKAIYDKTKRPIWITEWNNGASWTTESWPSGYGEKLEKNRAAIKEILNVLDTCRFIERYSIYNWDSYYRAMINTDDGWVTPAGQVYRDNKSTFAYNADVQFIPNWWTPSLKTVEMSAKVNSLSGKLVFTIRNTNGDLTDKMGIQRKKSDGSFEDYYVETDRSVFDQQEYTYSFDLDEFDVEEEEFRLHVTTTVGGETFSATTGLGYLVNPNIITNSKTDVDGWMCEKSAQNGFTKDTGDTYFEVWDPNAAGMHFNYYQDVSELADGVYELSAACFNSSNGQEGAYVNGNVGLYAQAEGIEYFAPVTEDGELDPDRRQVIPAIVVKGGVLRIGIKNIGNMTARWAGADEFKLRYLGPADEVLPEGEAAFCEKMRSESEGRYKALFVWNASETLADATGVIINPDCDRKDTYGWTAETVDFSSGEAFDGESSNPYWNKWSGSTYTSAMYQDFDFLPAGEYTVSALLRGSAGAPIDLYVSRDKGETKEAVYHFEGTGASVGSDYANGWHKVTTAPVILRRGESLRIGFTTTLTNQWWSADCFSLTFAPVDFTGMEGIKNNLIPEVKISTENQGVLLEASEPVDITIYSSSGAVVYKKKISTGPIHVPLPAGLYIVNKQKVVVR